MSVALGEVPVSRVAECMLRDKYYCPGRPSTLVETGTCVKGAGDIARDKYWCLSR